MDDSSQKTAYKIQYLSTTGEADILFFRVHSYSHITDLPITIIILIVHSVISHVYLLH